jgi:hypothetical protein
VFVQFRRAFATAEHPLALFIDDLQCPDTATLEPLDFLMTSRDVDACGPSLPQDAAQRFTSTCPATKKFSLYFCH